MSPSIITWILISEIVALLENPRLPNHALSPMLYFVSIIISHSFSRSTITLLTLQSLSLNTTSILRTDLSHLIVVSHLSVPCLIYTNSSIIIFCLKIIVLCFYCHNSNNVSVDNYKNSLQCSIKSLKFS